MFPCEKEDTNPLLFEKRATSAFFMILDVIVLVRNRGKSQTQKNVQTIKSAQKHCTKNNNDKLFVSKAMFFEVTCCFGKQFTC